MTDDRALLYWDSSAILAHLFGDTQSTHAAAYLRVKGRHFISSLAWAECAAAIARSQRSAVLTTANAELALGAILAAPWSALRAEPAPATLRVLARRYPLRGADLWHLALALDLGESLPGVRLLTFDSVLGAAAGAEGLAAE